MNTPQNKGIFVLSIDTELAEGSPRYPVCQQIVDGLPPTEGKRAGRAHVEARVDPGPVDLAAVEDVISDFCFHFEHFPWGCDYYMKTGRMMPIDGHKNLQLFNAIHFGAFCYPSVSDSVSLRGLRQNICQSFDQYVNLRPSHLLPGVKSL